MLAASPMDREDDLARALVDVGDDVRDEGAQQLLAGAHRHAGRGPCRFEIVGQAREIRHLDGCCRRQPFKPCFAGLDPLERGFPALLKLGGDQTIVGIARRIAAFGQRSLVASLLQLEISDALSFVSAFHSPSLSFQRGLDGHRFHDEEDLPRDRRLNPRAAESQAPGSAQHLVGAIATIDRPARASSRIGHRQPPSAAPAGEEPGQEGASASPGLWAAHQAMGVRGELGLVPIKLPPIDVSLVVILEQDLPFFKGSAVAVTLAGAAIDDLDPLLASAIGVGPSVEGVLQNRDDVAVADRRPIERDQLLAVRRSWKVDLIGRHREMHAASAAELPKSLEDLTDGFLDAQIGIEAEAEIAMPDVSDRHADAQLAPPCLGPSGLKHPGAQNAELELADAALHAQEQTVVRATRVVDPFEVNHACFDEPAQFEQVMPVASIAREPRGIQAQHGSNLPGAQGSHEPLEAWTGHHAAGGLTQIVIDDLDSVEPPSPCDLDE